MLKFAIASAATAAAAALLAASASAAPAASSPPAADLQDFRALYKELVETDTSITTGSCTLLADVLRGAPIDALHHELRTAWIDGNDVALMRMGWRA